MLTASELKFLLRAERLRLTKRLGQHHLIDSRIVRDIVERSDLSPRDTVVEIGAGLGALTEWLSQRAGRVIAVESDRRIARLLAERMRARKNIEVVCQDILEFDWQRFADLTVIGAIPYHITSPILVSVCDGRRAIRKAILILQREVAQRLLAHPGEKAYGRLSVLAQYYWEVTRLLKVPRGAFFPQPDVDSSCVQLAGRLRPPVQVASESTFFALVKAAFSQRRKTLVNCLSQGREAGMGRKEAERVLLEQGLPTAVRGESLSLDQFAALANALHPATRLR